ncbi:MAG: AMP-binding protein [Acidimicrobiales bacterium]|nr:AMP-binding protein [Acidimicrobiales bacterium]
MGFWSVARAHPDRAAVVAGGVTTTAGELAEAAESVARGLWALGLRRGDTLAIVVPNGVTFFCAHLAAMRAGLYLVPINTHLAGPEIAVIVGDCDAGALVVGADLAASCAAGADAAGIPLRHRFADPAAEGYRPLAELVALGAGAPPLPDGIAAGTTMMYTSGTTGRPKGVRRPLPTGEADDVYGSAAAVYCQGFGMTPGPGVHLVCGPLYHAGPSASATAALHAGHTVVVMDRWEPEACLDAVDRFGVTSTQMVPTMFHRLLALPPEVKDRYSLATLESVMHTGAPCPTPVKARLMEWLGPVVYETYGGTESVATIATPRRWLQKPGTVGRAIHGITLHILDDDGNELPAGEVGQIWVENANAPAAEYYKDPDKTSTMRRGGWVTLGDVGYVDDDGFLFLRDRAVDMIISGGVNIYPAEVESALLQSPLVGDAAVIGVPDDEWGEAVLAIVEPAPGVAPDDGTAAAILADCSTRLARFKLPRRIDFVTTLPRLPSGKLQKRVLRAPYWEGVDRSI